MQLELVLADADVVPRLEAGGFQSGDHADLLQPLLEIGKRLLVLEVVALEEQLDPAAEDAEGTVTLALDRVATLAHRPVDTVLDLEFGRAGIPSVGACRNVSGKLGEDQATQLFQAFAGRGGSRQHALHPVAESLSPLTNHLLHLLGGGLRPHHDQELG